MTLRPAHVLEIAGAQTLLHSSSPGVFEVYRTGKHGLKLYHTCCCKKQCGIVLGHQ